MKKYTWFIIILVIAIVGMSACTANEAPIDQEKEEPELPEEPSKTWDPTIEDTIEIEGEEEPITLKYFEGKNEFITYVPEDLLVDPVEYTAGEPYKFYANFEGKKNDEVNLQLLFYPKDLAEKPEITGDESEVVNEVDRIHEWALEEYKDFEFGTYGMLGQHEDQYFSIILNYTPEYAEGFVPRANKIIENLYWTDTNEYLIERD